MARVRAWRRRRNNQQTLPVPPISLRVKVFILINIAHVLRFVQFTRHRTRTPRSNDRPTIPVRRLITERRQDDNDKRSPDNTRHEWYYEDTRSENNNNPAYGTPPYISGTFAALRNAPIVSRPPVHTHVFENNSTFLRHCAITIFTNPNRRPAFPKYFQVVA